MHCGKFAFFSVRTTSRQVDLIVYWVQLTVEIITKCKVRYSSLSSSSAHYSALLGIGLSNFSPFRSISGYSHPAPASCPAQIVTPPGLRASPLQNSFNPAGIGSAADMANPLPLQRANMVCYVSDFSFLPDNIVSDSLCRETLSITLSIARWKSSYHCLPIKILNCWGLKTLNITTKLTSCSNYRLLCISIWKIV
jgi:hypothetical protein